MNKLAENRPKISKIWAKNFRSIESFEMYLDPLTVLVGPNASGKSNIVDVLRFMSDTIRNGLESALTNRRSDQVARRSQPRPKATDIVVGLRIEHELEYSVEYELTVHISTKGQHRLKQEKARVEVVGAVSGVFHIEIRNGRLVKPVIQQPKDMKPETFDGFTKLLETNTLDETSVALPFENITAMAALFRRVNWIESYSEVSNALTKIANLLKDVRFYHIFPNTLRDPQKMSA